MKTLTLVSVLCAASFGMAESAAAYPSLIIDDFSSGEFFRQETASLPMYDEVAVPSGSIASTRYMHTEGLRGNGSLIHQVGENVFSVSQEGPTGGVISTVLWSGGLRTFPPSGFGTPLPENGDFNPFFPPLDLSAEARFVLRLRNDGDDPISYSIFAYNEDFTVLDDIHSGTFLAVEKTEFIPLSEVFSAVDPSAVGAIGVRLHVTEDPEDVQILFFWTISTEETIRDVPSEYTTIQEAIIASTDGDLVAIAPGTYTGTGNRDINLLGRRIRVEGTGGRDVTIIDCEGSASDPHYGFRFSGFETKETVIAGLTILNAYTTGPGGAAIGETTWDPVEGTIENCRIALCQQPSSTIVRGRFDMENCIVENCTAAVIVDVTDASVRNMTLRNNAGGIVLYLGGMASLQDSWIQGNSGVGVFVQGPYEMLIERTVISGNGAGIYVDASDPGQLVVRETTIAANQWDAIGGFQSSAIFQHCIFWGNRDLGSAGSDDGEWVLDCCLYPEGEADGEGFILVGPQIYDDPLFCDGRDWTEAPTDEGDYSIRAGSPCFPENNACATQLGALGLGNCEPATIGDDNSPHPTSSLELTCTLPARGELRFRTELGAGSVAEVVDLAGRIVATRSLAAGPPGREIIWRLGGSKIRSGVYFLRLRSGDGRFGAAQKFVWLGP